MVSASGSPLVLATGVAPALKDWQFSMSGLVGGAGTPYLMHDWEGFGSTDVRTTDLERSLEDGDWLGKDTYASRSVTLSMSIVGSSAAEAYANYDLLTAAWRTPNYSIVTELWWKFPGQAPRRLVGRPRKLAANVSRALSGIITVQAEFYSPYPHIYGANVLTPCGPEYGFAGGRTYAPTFTYPRMYGADTRNHAIIYNTTPENYPILYFRGPMTNPRMYQKYSDIWIMFSGSLAVGETLIVDMKLRTARLGVQNWRPKLAGGSRWWGLDVGRNDLYYPYETGSVTILYAPAWLG